MSRKKRLRTTCGLIVTLAACILAPSVPLAADSYQIDAGHSYVVFKVRHFGIGDNYGRFNTITGSYAFDAENPANSKLAIEIDASSVDTASEKRDQHLRSPDFFNVKQFPKITFKSAKVEDKGDGLMHVTGKLSLHGVSKEVTIPVRFLGETDDPWGKHRSGFSADFSVRRTDYGMNYMVPGIGDEITLMVGIEGTRE